MVICGKTWGGGGGGGTYKKLLTVRKVPVLRAMVQTQIKAAFLLAFFMSSERSVSSWIQIFAIEMSSENEGRIWQAEIMDTWRIFTTTSIALEIQTIIKGGLATPIFYALYFSVSADNVSLRLRVWEFGSIGKFPIPKGTQSNP